MNTLRKGQRLVHGMTVKDESYFEKRREVMAIIYELKRSVELPRIEVKIAKSSDGKCAGLGWTDERHTIAIADTLSGKELFIVTLHELVHTVFKFKGHDERCPLMCSVIDASHTKEVYMEAFLKYAKRAA